MGKVILFAVLTMDGCLADSSGKAQQWLAKTDTPDRFGIAGMKETARPLSEYTSLTMLVLDKSDTTCFIEANTAGQNHPLHDTRHCRERLPPVPWRFA